MRILLDLEITFSSVENLDLLNEPFLKEVIDTFRNEKHFKLLRYYGSGARLQKIEKIEPVQLAKKISKSSLIYLCDHSNPNKSDNLYRFLIDFSIRNSEARIMIEINHIELKDISNSIAFFVKTLDVFINMFKGKIKLNLASSIRLPGIEYPRIRPPRFTGRYIRESIVDIINPNNIEFDDEEKITKSLCLYELPNSVVRRKIGKYYCIDWTGNTIESLFYLQKILSERERWLYENGGFELDGFNENGDEADGLWGGIPTEYLTFYREFDGTGLKATVLNPDGSYDEKLFKELKDWTEKRQMPDGTLVNSIGIILPNRESCLKIKPIAEQFDFAKVLYPSDDGQLWNPFPKGSWLE